MSLLKEYPAVNGAIPEVVVFENVSGTGDFLFLTFCLTYEMWVSILSSGSGPGVCKDPFDSLCKLM